MDKKMKAGKHKAECLKVKKSRRSTKAIGQFKHVIHFKGDVIASVWDARSS